MSSTIFVNGVTLTDSSWFNDTNAVVYTCLNAPASLAALKATVFATPYAVGMQQVTRATADQSITSNTVLASATNMSFAIAASEEWVADFYIYLGARLDVTGFKLALTVPSGATMELDVGMMPGGIEISTSNGKYYDRTATSGTGLDFTTANCVNDLLSMVVVSAWVLNSTNAGTVQLQIAQSSSSATALILRKGSHMRASRVA